MRQMCVTESSQGMALMEEQAPQPQPGPIELLVRVHAAGVTPTELHWYPTSHGRSGEKRNAAVPGHEFSGVVVEAGQDVGHLEIGREVFGLNDWFSGGAMAEYCITPFFSVASKPASLTHVEAASIPIGALTAWQGLFDRAQLQAGERVLVHGGAGSVGVFAIQFARMRGACVVTTASARNRDLVMSLGAEQFIDYQHTRFEESASDFDVVFDTVGGETLARSWSVLKPQGRMVTIAAGGSASADQKVPDKRVKDAFFIVEANQKQLTEIAALLEGGTLQTVVDVVVPLSQASDAYAGRVERRGRGKLVVAVAA